MKQLLIFFCLFILFNTGQSQTLEGKRVMNISASDLMGNLNSGHNNDNGTITALNKSQNIGVSLKFNIGKFDQKNNGWFYGVEIPFRYSNAVNSGSQTVYGIYPSISYAKLVQVAPKLYLTSEIGMKIGYERDNIHLINIRDEATNIWQVGTFYRPMTAIWYVKKSTAFIFSIYDVQLTFTSRVGTVNNNPGKKTVISNVQIWGHFNPSFGVQLLLK